MATGRSGLESCTRTVTGAFLCVARFQGDSVQQLLESLYRGTIVPWQET